MGISTEDFQVTKSTSELSSQPFNELHLVKDNAVYIVKIMIKTERGVCDNLYLKVLEITEIEFSRRANVDILK